MNCMYCGQPKANVKKGLDWFHQNCWDRMPPNGVFPPNFRRKTAEMIMSEQVQKQVKNGKFIS